MHTKTSMGRRGHVQEPEDVDDAFGSERTEKLAICIALRDERGRERKDECLWEKSAGGQYVGCTVSSCLRAARTTTPPTSKDVLCLERLGATSDRSKFEISESVIGIFSCPTDARPTFSPGPGPFNYAR